MAVEKLSDEQEELIAKRFNKKEIDALLAGADGNLDVAIGRFLLVNGWNHAGDGKKVTNPDFSNWKGGHLTSTDSLTQERLKLLYDKATK